jgi:hypothetical protein
MVLLLTARPTGLGADVGERGSDGGISNCLWGSLNHLFGGIMAVKEGGRLRMVGRMVSGHGVDASQLLY